MKKIADIQFTENGVLIEKSYHEDNTVLVNNAPKPEKYAEFLEIAKRLAKYRMARCYAQLHSNLTKAPYITKQIIAWNGGHFSVPVWKALEGILELKDIRQMDALQTQQIIRAMLMNNNSNWVYDSDYRTGKKANDKGIYMEDDFRNFITEHMLIGVMSVTIE